MIASEIFQKAGGIAIADILMEKSGIAEFIKIDNTLTEEEKTRRLDILKNKYLDEITKIKKGEYAGSTDDSAVIIVYKDEKEDGDFYEAAWLKREDFEKVMGLNPLDPHSFNNPMISLMFDDRINVYNAEISDISCEEYPLEEIAACLIYEMCFFGIDNEDYNKNKEYQIQKLIESAENAKNDEGIPAEELFERLGLKDERSEEEKKEQREKMIKNMENNIKNKIILMKDTVSRYK